MSTELKKGYLVTLSQRLNRSKASRLTQARIFIFNRDGVWKAEVTPRLSSTFLDGIKSSVGDVLPGLLLALALERGTGDDSNPGMREFEIQIHARNPRTGKAQVYATAYIVNSDDSRIEIDHDSILDFKELENDLCTLLPDILANVQFEYAD